MRIIVTSRHLSALTMTLVLLLSVTLTLPGSASAASKEYEVYKGLKLGMTATEVSKVLHGKNYRSHLKKEYKVTTLTDKFTVRDIQKDYKLYSYALYPFDSKDKSWYYNKMRIVLKTKQGGTTLYLAQKDFTPEHPSEKRIYKGKKIRVGMTIDQVDEALSGKGLGSFSSHYTEDYSKIGEVYYHNPVGYPPKLTVLQYHYRSYDEKDLLQVTFKYDYKKNMYFVQK